MFTDFNNFILGIDVAFKQALANNNCDKNKVQSSNFSYQI